MTTETAPAPEAASDQALAWLLDEWAEGRSHSGAALARKFDLHERTGQLVVKRAEAKAGSDPAAPPKPKPQTRKRTPKPDPRYGLGQSLAAERAPEPVAAPVPRPEPEPDPTPHPEAETQAAAATPGRITRWDLAALGLVALVAAVLSFAHQWHLAQLAGEGKLAWLLPFSVDGMVAVASRTMLARRRSGRPAKLATAALIAAVCASVVANVWGADPNPAGWAVAAWPPLAYLVAYELLLQQLHPNGGESK